MSPTDRESFPIGNLDSGLSQAENRSIGTEPSILPMGGREVVSDTRFTIITLGHELCKAIEQGRNEVDPELYDDLMETHQKLIQSLSDHSESS